jgi:hypothetical protein
MTFLMRLIEKIKIDEIDFNFYEGIDFDVLKSHPKGGESGFIFFFIDNWVKEIKKWERDSKIKSVLINHNFKKFDSRILDNNYICIYQTQNTKPEMVFNIIKDKVLNKNFVEHLWLPVSGYEKGAWRIVNSKISN